MKGIRVHPEIANNGCHILNEVGCVGGFQRVVAQQLM
jgi:hypothetical protein